MTDPTTTTEAPVDPVKTAVDEMKDKQTGTLHLYITTLQLHGDQSSLGAVYDAFTAFQQAVTDAGFDWGGKAQVVLDPAPPEETAEPLIGSESTTTPQYPSEG